ncbi:ectoine/hydroxyectoine ABC transporter permease subunit EhuC [Pseudomonas sp. SZMC_28357]|uniref:ectoine/hydroxyectoine ABC transporter permease subunit EhuC n=1 Tax=Pseudomonas sp. SZMC_28357 TaxID=3074380 RepID=UPI002871D77C|nr:ectoine/hydroxyectoine ABC transporter permease subunit EhuC [Pseudomonas sp. SZMC_28357]MDR9752697.1 ectoine/hydroxyectoine ABC transporter permease subunit EhuC [Pseudomonas sp. SZMC_28357]
MEVVWAYRFEFLSGLWWTVRLAVVSALLALVLAFIAGIARSSRSRWLNVPATLYVEFFRGTSALAQLFWLFYVLPYLGIDLTPFECGVIGLGLCFSAYGAEVVRMCIDAVPQGQLDAAAALNLGRAQTLRVVVLPEAMIMMMPLFNNLLIELIKATSLVSLITIPDLAFQAKSIISKTYQSGAVLLVTLVMYLLISLLVSSSMRKLERLLSRGRRLGSDR